MRTVCVSVWVGGGRASRRGEARIGREVSVWEEGGRGCQQTDTKCMVLVAGVLQMEREVRWGDLPVTA